MSNWPRERVEAAADDGWLLAYTVDSGQRHAYLRVYPHGPAHADPHKAAQHVLDSARRGSKLHIAAMQLVMASVTRPSSSTPKGKK